jgi:hypothetical protein
MSTKYINFLAMSWFISVLICIVIEGSSFGSSETSMIRDLSFLGPPISVGGLFSIPTFNFNFFNGIYRLLTWDYSFYYGGYIYIRYLWMAVLSTGAVWGIGSTLAPIFSNFFKLGRG